MSRVTEIRHIGYALPDIEAERAFYREVWGLVEAGELNGMIHFAAPGSEEPFVVRLRRAEQKRVDVIGLAARSRADVDALHDRVAAAGCRMIFTPRDLVGFGGGYGFRFFSPDGLPLEVSAEVGRRQTRPLKRWEAAPERISHVVLHSPRHKEAVQFFIDVLGFRLSDWIGDFMAFLRCNSWHHRIAFLPGPPCLNHVAYDLPGVDDLMRGASRLKGHGFDLRWGPGRHTAGDNIFSYFVTPGGFAVEYTTGLEQVDEASWTPQVYAPTPQIMDQWGVGVGGPQAMPEPVPDAGLFQPPAA